MTERHPLYQAAADLQAQLSVWRRDFHRNPELGYEETRTAGIVADHLTRLGLEVRTGVGKTGVVGLLRGAEPGPTVLLRADMDALPIPDGKEADYASTVKGKAHLCGHDGHTSMLMAAALLLAKNAPPKGNIKFMFQPAEEGLAGAKSMIDDGVLEHPRVDAAFALHVKPTIASGRIGVGSGTFYAAADRIRIRIIGRGGHAAAPHQTIDSIPIAAQVITALQSIASRQTDPLDAVVVTIGQIQGGFASNVIAPEVELSGTVRTLNPALQELMPARIERIVRGVTESFGASYAFDYNFSYPMVINDEQMTEHISRTADVTLGSGSWFAERPTMGGEDFAFVAREVPSALFWLGVGDGTERTSYPLHHPKFDLDENALPVGAAMLASAALNYLEQHS
ncbi:M20 metallopeptidase family protein [Cohnella sp. JJ-181]|uniref:M20 metallopeptidase family protein n=1 Tax=Cohnella rhizoplanae TaxID=2974897 RepID=UPI0022FF5787|nr:M20 family metallopeptidase [Cohnella sp. JJ-181]CAI6084968.1 N-acetylcysteine deacetylase [Cohnella sp. JJ-181]